MFILPTMGRPHNLKRFVEAYNATGATLPVYVILDAADAINYKDVAVPGNFKRCSVPAGTRIGTMYQIMYREFPNEEYYGIIADDVVPETPGWDVMLKDACLPNKISWGFDGIQNGVLPTHPFIGGELVKKLGWWAPPGIQHWFIDNIWKIIADQLGCGVYLPDVRVIHHHPINQKAVHDATYANQPDHTADQIAANRFIQQELHAALVRASS